MHWDCSISTQTAKIVVALESYPIVAEVQPDRMIPPADDRLVDAKFGAPEGPRLR